MKKTGIFLSCILIGVLVIILGVSSIRIKKSDKTSSISSSNRPSVEVGGNYQNSSNSSSQGNLTNSDSKGSDYSIALEEVDGSTKFVDSGTVSAFVGSKSILYNSTDGTYSYSVNLVLSVGKSDEFRNVRYFCSEYTYSNLSKGDGVTVEYKIDSEDNISITSISN